jgi:hypothetical protein
VYTKYKELKLPKVDGNRLVTDFVFIVESITLSWLEYWTNELDKREWEKKTLLIFFELVEIYRNYCYLKLAYKGKTLEGSFAATLKNKLSKPLNLKPKLLVDE